MRWFTLTRPLTRASQIEALILDQPALSFRSLHNNIAGGRQAHLMLFEGRPEALKALNDRYLSRPPRYMEAFNVIHRRRGAIYAYAVERTGQHPSDIADKIERYLGPGTCSAYQKSIAGVTWTFLTSNEKGLPRFLKAIARSEQHWKASAGIEFGPYQLTTPRASRLLPVQSSLAPGEETVLELAVRRGFYAQPKQCGISEIAREAGLPASTAHHRLKRAERKILSSYVRA